MVHLRWRRGYLDVNKLGHGSAALHRLGRDEGDDPAVSRYSRCNSDHGRKSDDNQVAAIGEVSLRLPGRRLPTLRRARRLEHPTLFLRAETAGEPPSRIYFGAEGPGQPPLFGCNQALRRFCWTSWSLGSSHTAMRNSSMA